MKEQFIIMRIKQPNVMLTERDFGIVPLVESDTVTIKFFNSQEEAKAEIEAKLKNYQSGPYIIVPAYL